MVKISFIYNALSLSIISIIIKGLGLFNKIYLSRILLIETLSLLTLSFPTINLLITISSFSLSFSICKLISSGRTNNRSLIIKSFIFSTIISTILSLLLLIFSDFISIKLLKNINLKIILISSIPLIYLSSISSILKGYLAGIGMVKTNGISNIYEHISKTLFIILFSLVFMSLQNSFQASLIMISNGLAEGLSIIYLLIKIKKVTKLNFKINNKKEIQEVLKISIPSTISKLIISICLFLEPVIFTNTLLSYNLDIKKISYLYTILHSFSISLLTLSSFIISSVNQSLLPAISKNNNPNYYINRSIGFIIVPVLFLSIISFFYGDSLIYLLFKSNDGGLYSKYLSMFFILNSIASIYQVSLQGLNKINLVLYFSIFISILQLLLIYLFSYINPVFSIVYAINTTIVISFIFYFVILKKDFNYKINKKRLISIIISISLSFILLNIINNYLIGSIICLIICLLFNKNHLNFKEISKDE